MLRTIVLLLLITGLINSAQATSSTYGSEFFIGFMRNIGATPFTSLKITVGTPMMEAVEFVVENNIGVLRTGVVTSNAPMVIVIPSDRQVTTGDINNREKGIRVSSVTNGNLLYVIAENFVTFLNYGVYTAYPCQSLGNEYEYGIVSAGNSFRSQFLLVGCSNDTIITVTPTQSVTLPTDTQVSSTTLTIAPDTQSNDFILHRMQTLLVSSFDDLSGTIITSNKPLVVISGHECANIPLSEAGCEPLAVQVPPIATWGTEFFLAPFAGRDGPQAFKAVSSKTNTSFVYTCNSESSLAPETNILSLFSDSYCFLQSSDPILVTTLSFGGTIDNQGDPSISIVSPIDQHIQNIDFVSLPTKDFPSNYITVTISAQHYDPESILLDGQPIGCEWQEIIDADDNVVGYGCNRTVSSNINVPMKHTISHSADGLLSVVAYGFNSFPALGYAYLTGQELKISDDGDDNFLPLLDLATLPGMAILDNSSADSTSNPIPIPGGFIFGNETATVAYVNENGVISFNNLWRFSVPDKLPTNNFYTRTGLAVAPFWSDNDIRKEGSVKYVTFDANDAATNPQGSEWLQQVNRYIQRTRAVEEEPFRGIWILTAHWDGVHPSPHGEDDHRDRKSVV